MNYAGIDIADKASAVCVVDEAGGVLDELTAATAEESLREALLGWGVLRVVVESCPLAEWLARCIEAAGHEAVVIDARAAKGLMAVSKKTDTRDARTLARMAHTGWYTPVHRKSPPARLRRSQLQSRQALVRVYVRMASQVRGLLRAHGVRVGSVSQGQFADRVRGLVGEQLPELAEFLEPLLEVYERSLGEAKRLGRELKRQARSEELVERLQSVPGVGPLVSQAYVATIDDPSRFANNTEVADYVGLTPRVYQSGETHYHGRISREGDTLLRWHLVEAAHALLVRGQDCALKRWGQQLAERKGQAKAKVALARKLAIVLRRLWISGERFQAWPQAVA